MPSSSSGNKNISGFIPSGNLVSFSWVTMLFLIWGIPNNMNDILIKQFMKSFELNRFQAGLIQSAFYMGYFVLAVPAGLLMKRYSCKAGLIVGLLLFACGCFLFWPAALIGKYGVFLFALFVIASGLTFLETGAFKSIALNTTNPRRVKDNVNMACVNIPVQFWMEMANSKLLNRNAIAGMLY